MTDETNFTPALGNKRLTPLYDYAIAALTREARWREKLISQIGPVPSDRILDVGCGTGTLAIRLKKVESDAEIVGIDPDPEVIERARRKAQKTGVAIEWRIGFLTTESTVEIGSFSKVESSLVFHQTSMAEKQNILNAIRSVLRLGGTLHVADYGLQRTALMRTAFRNTVQRLDGIKDTQPNADGILPHLMRSCGFTDVQETDIIPTATGSISLYRARVAP